MKCKYCGTEFENSPYCPNCGSNNDNYKEPEDEVQDDVFEEEPAPKVTATKTKSVEKEDDRPPRSRLVAGLLAIFFGGIGVQAFYLGKLTRGIFSVIFCWTGIPAIVGFFEGLIILVGNTRDFEERYNVRNTDKED